MNSPQRNAGNAGLGAQEERKGLDLCSKCFDMVPVSGHICHEQGCPMMDTLGAETADVHVYPELAKANLLRMRGEFKLARDACLSILKRYPGNATAHTLLGDISAEEGDLHQAAEWYEMALDITPDSEADLRKLERVRARMTERDAIHTAQQLGLPTQKSPAKWLAIGAVAIVVTGGIVAFALTTGDGPKVQKGRVEIGNRPDVSDFPSLTDPGEKKVEAKTDEKKPDPTGDEKTQEPPATGGDGGKTDPPAGAENALLDRLRNEAFEGNRVLMASLDETDQSVKLVVRAGDQDDPKDLAAALAVGTLDLYPDAPKVRVSVERGATVVLIGEVTREKLDPAREQIGPLSRETNREALLGVLDILYSP